MSSQPQHSCSEALDFGPQIHTRCACSCLSTAAGASTLTCLLSTASGGHVVLSSGQPLGRGSGEAAGNECGPWPSPKLPLHLHPGSGANSIPGAWVNHFEGEQQYCHFNTPVALLGNGDSEHLCERRPTGLAVGEWRRKVILEMCKLFWSKIKIAKLRRPKLQK